MLKGEVALVTGASRGIGRGIALQLGSHGATVYVTGRHPSQSDNSTNPNLPTLEATAKEVTERGGRGVAVFCDHGNPKEVETLFQQIDAEQEGRLDILVNNAYSAVTALSENFGKKFYETDPLMWDEVNNVGLRNHYICSVYAARMMVKRGKGLIVIVSSAGGLDYEFNVCYGVGKAACDRMAVDMAHELRKSNICCVSLWPGAVRTELFSKLVAEQCEKNEQPEDFPFDANEMKEMGQQGESVEYAGKCVAALACDTNVMKKTGRVLISGDLGDEYGFTDVDGRKPSNLRSLKLVLQICKWNKLASFVPDWIKIPSVLLSVGSSRF